MTKDEDIDKALDLMKDAILHMLHEADLPPGAVLAAAHAEIVAIMCHIAGGAQVAQMLERSAEQVRSVSASDDFPLAGMTPIGSA